MHKGIKWRWPQKMRIRISQPPMVGSYSNLKLKPMGINQSAQRYQMKTTSNGRWPQNMRIRISQPPMVGSYSNLKLKLMGINQSAQRYQMKMTSNGKQPQMEDDLEWKMILNWRWPQNMKSRLYQQLLVESYSNFKL